MGSDVGLILMIAHVGIAMGGGMTYMLRLRVGTGMTIHMYVGVYVCMRVYIYIYIAMCILLGVVAEVRVRRCRIVALNGN